MYLNVPDYDVQMLYIPVLYRIIPGTLLNAVPLIFIGISL